MRDEYGTYSFTTKPTPQGNIVASNCFQKSPPFNLTTTLLHFSKNFTCKKIPILENSYAYLFLKKSLHAKKILKLEKSNWKDLII